MAASVVRPLFSNFLCCYLLLFSSVAAAGNTSDDNATASGDQNVTFNDSENFTTAEPTEFDPTSPTWSRSSTEEPVRPDEPLPVSGRLLVPVIRVDSLCPCDEHKDECDVNCCCDAECREEVSLFTGCSVDTVSGNKQLCRRDVASYSLMTSLDGHAELHASVRTESSSDVFCVHAQNRVDGFSHPPPALPSDTSFDSLFEQFAGFLFGPEEVRGHVSPAEQQASSGYQYGDVMETAGQTGQTGQTGLLMLPAPGVTADCVDVSPAAFLVDQRRRCSRPVVLQQDCGALPALSLDAYTNIQLFAEKKADAALLPVTVASVVLQSVDGTQTELQLSEGQNLDPVLLDPGLLDPPVCANVVLQVAYVIKYDPAGVIVNATASLLLGFVPEATPTLQQEFLITFVQEDLEDVSVHYSGNPGYVVGLPLVSGKQTADGFARSVDPRDTLSLLHSAEDQDCLQGPGRRSPVLFGVDSVSGCTLRLEDAANCSLVFQAVLDVLRGPDPPHYVASFGNSPLDFPLDWIPVKTSFNAAEVQSCSIPLSLHLEIQWTKVGSLLNPQAQIVSVREVVQTNSSSLAWLSGGSSFLSISSSVTFVPVSAAAAPGYRAAPTINARLPANFFYPFV